MGLWDGLDTAQTYDRGTFLKPGRYTLKIKNCIDKMTVKSGQAFIVEFEVVETSDPANHPVGSTCSWFQKMSNRQVALGAVKEFMAAVYGYPLGDPNYKARFEREVAPQLVAIATAATTSNSLAGQVVKVETSMVTTQPKPGQPQGSPFTRHNWIANAARP